MKQLTKGEVSRRITEIGIVPVVRAPSADLAVAAPAICAGGIPISSMPGKTLIGAGTALDADTAQRCFDAGAQFLER